MSTSIQKAFRCVYCGNVETGDPEWTIHRDGFADGPEVPLCSECGESEAISCEAIWRRLNKLKAAPVQLNNALN
jgi:NAD-dependent SIR2 family protein deacetylase